MTKPNENSTTKAVERVAVVLAKPHTHAGKDYQAGDTIEVTAKQRAFLEEAGALRKPAVRVDQPAEEK
ncbi:hypothetical protein D9M72_266380 [compost metagenome]